MWFVRQGEKLKLHIKVKASAKKTQFVRIKSNLLYLDIKANAHENAANKELIRFLARYFSLLQRQVRILRGVHNPLKIVEMPVTQVTMNTIERIAHDLTQPW